MTDREPERIAKAKAGTYRVEKPQHPCDLINDILHRANEGLAGEDITQPNYQDMRLALQDIRSFILAWSAGVR